MPKRAAEDFPFLASQTDGGDAHRDVLRRNHLSNDASGRIGSGKQHGTYRDLPANSHLQIAEK
jgi:hypothetical protein